MTGDRRVGEVTTPVADDPTLRPGDIVATNAGLMAYNGGPNNSTFTPVSTYAGLSADLRRQLTKTKIEPAVEKPAPPPVRQVEATPAAAPRISGLRPTGKAGIGGDRAALARLGEKGMLQIMARSIPEQYLTKEQQKACLEMAAAELIREITQGRSLN
jgi:hypothetical protein